LRDNYYFLRALHGRGTLRVPGIGREASRPYTRTIVLVTFYEIIIFGNRETRDGL